MLVESAWSYRYPPRVSTGERHRLAPAEGGAGRSVEGPGAALRSVSPGAGEAADSGDRCYRSEAVWLHLGDRSGGAVKGALSAEACPVRPGRVEGQGHPYPALAAFKARLDCDAGVQRALREETVEPMRAEV